MWTPFSFFVGTWRGTGNGQPNISQVERIDEFGLNDKFLQVRNKSTYLPQKQNPKGEAHEDWGLIGYDKARKTFVFRQFHVEGLVNQYVLDSEASLAPDGPRIVFATGSIENIPADWRVKEAYQVLNPDEFTETFELAAPGEDFAVYSKSHLRLTVNRIRRQSLWSPLLLRPRTRLPFPPCLSH